MQRGNRQRSLKSREPRSKIRTFDFDYNFREYLKLSLAKKMPRKSGITFIPDKGIIIGEERVCTGLITEAIQEMHTHKFSVKTFRDERQLDEIEYWMKEGVNIYRPGVIEVALKELEGFEVFGREIEEMRGASNMFLLRFAKEEEQTVMERLYEIKREEQEGNKSTINDQSLSSFPEGVTITENSENYYNLKE